LLTGAQPLQLSVTHALALARLEKNLKVLSVNKLRIRGMSGEEVEHLMSRLSNTREALKKVRLEMKSTRNWDEKRSDEADEGSTMMKLRLPRREENPLQVHLRT
jgi:hypothetical protein